MFTHNLLSLLLAPDAPNGGAGGGSGEGASTSAPSARSTGSSGGEGGAVGASPAAAPSPALDDSDTSDIDALIDPPAEDNVDELAETLAEGGKAKADATDPEATIEGGDANDEDPKGEVEGDKAADDLLSDDELNNLIRAIQGNPQGQQAAAQQTAAAPAQPQQAQTQQTPAQQTTTKTTETKQAAPDIVVPELKDEDLADFVNSVGEKESATVVSLLKGMRDTNAALVERNKSAQDTIAKLTERLDKFDADIAAARQQHQQAQEEAQARTRIGEWMGGIVKATGYDAARFGKFDPSKPVTFKDGAVSGGGLTDAQWEQCRAVDALGARIYEERKAQGRPISEAAATDAAVRAITRAQAKKAEAAPATRGEVVSDLRRQSNTRSPAGMSRGTSRSTLPAIKKDQSGEDFTRDLLNSITD